MDVVASLPESHLRAILVALFKDPYTHDRVISMASKLAAAPSSCNGSDLAICVQCKQAFSVLTRAENSCHYHPGTRWADESNEAWEDHFVNTDGPMETEENMEDWPDAFVWDCCQKTGSARGCKVGQHRS
ncbi:uncharacterized protein BBA_00226 [Beauveria bassiana ARSEF 2860]|uniref:C2H2-type domain-containing protein n=1 Tax=Beauveria bassiana (strain ARSEF 2860) TaxID=655819 RepID=J5K8Z2_BEAB2|nr:uncharacterized protein BBA_00226 [Beauveria bassiana ARSEF 2860]EJP70596.1 hypothetical protein BBA_00226 [Beauveria bassiana ARSEF 2860]